MFLIWSIEHQAWWAPNEAGYTRIMAEAGWYLEAQASAIVTRANTVTFNEAEIPIQCLSGCLPSMSTLGLRR